jgi:hypothetical protein
MKYFTPERYVALQDFSSDEVMNAADAAWEEAVDQYDASYRSIEALLPPEYRRLQEDYYLHDARVLYIGQQGKRFVIALRLDPPPQQILQLTYELDGEPIINREAIPAAHRGTGAVDWMHDEVEVVSQSPLVCMHSILFGNGWEVRLPFRALRVEEVQALIPAPHNDHVSLPASQSQPV